ncbi:MAG: protein kinase [Candidatus Aminicenantes bacterium]|nr:protein kinase [Candidatus Aminicenantes bacterium]
MRELTPQSRAQAPSLAVTQTIESRAWDLATGAIFGERYQIIELLGRGGMGRVYRALDTKTREEVALKLIRPDIAEDKRTLERFVNEIKLAHKISHRNIGRMYHLGEDRGLHYITMEYVPGEDLKSFIRRSRRLDIATTVAIAKQVCSGLSEAHDAGIVHRDLKPGNIMIDKEGNAKILDFGIARAVGSQSVTGEGIVIGTPEYMSPEQVEGKESDKRSDIYSFGVILFEMVTGRLPFAADTPFVVAFKQQSERPPQPEDLNPQTPPQLGAIILRCLEKDREKRYQSSDEICRDLSQVEETMQTTPVPAPWSKPTTRKTRLPAPVLSFPWRKAFIPAVAFLGIMAAGIAIRGIIPKAKGAVHTVAVVGFENLTGDSAYEYLKKAIPNLLITSLEQSKYLEVMSWERLSDLAGQMRSEQPHADGMVSEQALAAERDAWFEICRREGIEAIVLGSFTKAENLFATDAKIYDVQTKNLLKSTGSRGEGVGSILRTQIDELSREISKGVGLSERAAAKDAVPITRVTTASMEAYEFFLKGQEDFDRYYFDDARLSLEKAVAKDPDFALAYFYLTRVYQSLADAPRAEKAMEQFKKLSLTGTAKGKEGLYIAALSRLMEKDVQGYVKGLKDVINADPKDKRALVDLAWFYKNQKKYAEAIPLFDKALEIDPGFGYALNLLAYTYSEMGEKEKALKTFDHYAAAQPGDANPIDSMGDLYFLTGKFSTARAKYEQALAIRPQFPSAWKLAYLYAMEGDYGQALQWADHLIAHAETDGIRAQGHQWKGFYYSLMGHFNEALHELEAAESLARAADNFQLTDFALREALWICYDWGRFDLYKAFLEKRLAYRAESKQATPTLNKVYEDLYSGLLDIKNGNVAAARKKFEEILSLSASVGEKEKDFNLLAADHLKREILFAEGAYDEAIRVFKDSPGVMIDLGVPMTVQQKNLPFQADFIARALLKKGQTSQAIAEYERLVSPDADVREKALVHPFSRMRLAALYEAKGDLDRAAEQYEIVVKSWKNADPGLPEVEAARKKLTSLKARTARPKGATVDAFYPLPLIGAQADFFLL